MSGVSSVGASRPWSGLIARASAIRAMPAICAVVLLLLGVVAVFGTWLAPADPYAIDLFASFRLPSSDHLLGADASGRDLLSRLLVGARSSLLSPLVVALAATAVGSALGILMAWTRGAVDAVLSRVLDVMLGFPGLILAILAVSIVGRGLTAPVIALSLSYLPYVARVIRSAALQQRDLPYMEALWAQGHGSVWICLRHLVPNVRSFIVAQATILYGYAMVDLAAISFLGLGVQPPEANWGAMLASGQAAILLGHPQEAFYAGLLVVLTAASVDVLGQRIVTIAEEGRS